MATPQAKTAIPEDGRQSPAALAIARGVRRLLWTRGLASITELVLPNGRRADVVGLSAKGEIWIVEVKSSVIDFRTDQKWPEYREFCDRLLFAVAPDFPADILPEETGLVIADQWGGDLLREAPLHALAGARRKSMLMRYARFAAVRLHALADPEFGIERLE